MRDNLQKIVANSVAQVLKVELEFIEDKSRDLIEEWDSLAHMEIVLRIEETLGISLPEESIPYIESLVELQDLVLLTFGKQKHDEI